MHNMSGQLASGGQGDRHGIGFDFLYGDAHYQTWNVTVHEIGHVAATQLGYRMWGGDTDWSVRSQEWTAAGGWVQLHEPGQGKVGDNWFAQNTQTASESASTNPVEDFAETFRYHVQRPGGASAGARSPSPSREAALTTALGYFGSTH